MTHQHTSYGWCPLCEAECGIQITTQGRRVISVRGDEKNTFSKGSVCPKAASLKDLHNDPDRLKYPMKRTGTTWTRIDWDEAFDLIEHNIAGIRNTHGNDAVALFMGNPNVHYHANLIYIGLLLKALNTKNRYSSSSLDQLPLMMASYLVFGHQMLFPVPDVDRTDYMIIMGGNPAVSGGSIMTAPGIGKRIRQIRKRRGKVVVIDPVHTRTADLADQHLFIRPGTDVFLLAAMVNTLFAEGLVTPGRLASFSDGLETVKAAVNGFTPKNVSGITGIGAGQIQRLVREFAHAEKAVCYGRMGTCTQEYGTLSTWLMLVFNSLTGNLDRPGGAMFTTPAVDLVGFTALAQERGWVGKTHTRVNNYPDFAGEFPAAALAEEILTPGEGRIRGLITLAGNPVIAAPNGRMMDKALSSLEFMVSVDWYISESSRHAHIILPPTTVLEHENHMMMVNLSGVRNYAAYSEAALPKEPGTRHNSEILSELTARMIKNPLLRFAVRKIKPEWLLDGLIRLGPHGSFLPFQTSALRLSAIKKAKHGIDLGPLKPQLPGRLFTPSKRMQLAPDRLVSALGTLRSNLNCRTPSPEPPLDLVLIGRRNSMSNNSWFHNFERLHNRANRCTLFLNPGDAEKKGIQTGDRVRVTSSVHAVELEAEVTDRIMPGVVSIPHGWGHHRPGVRLRVARVHAGVSINDITDHKRLDLSGNAAFSGTPVSIGRV